MLKFKKWRGIAHRRFYNGWKEDAFIADIDSGEKIKTYYGNGRHRMRIKAHIMNVKAIFRIAAGAVKEVRRNRK